MKHYRTVLILAVTAVLTQPLLAANHDLAITLTTTAVQGRFPVNQQLKFTIRITNNGPETVQASEGLKYSINKFDHTGQQFIKVVGTRDLPLLPPPGGQGDNYFIYEYFDSATQAGAALYKASLGPGYYTDSNNTNHRPESWVTFYNAAPSPVRWTSRLTEQDFTRAGATLNADQLSKLNANTYTIQGIVNSTTDRLYDGAKCINCHNGNATQVAARYRPVLPVERGTAHRANRTDANTTSTYTWLNAGKDGVVAYFLSNANSPKPAMLEKIFHLWLLDGAQQ